MSSRNLGRRAFLRGVGGVSVGLPFLNAIHGRAGAQAVAQRPKRLVVLFHPQGTFYNRWKPATTGALSAALPSILSPLEPYKSRLNVLSGIDNIVSPLNTASNGHNGAARSILTCQPFVGVKNGQNPDNGPADGPSFDWAIGARLKGDAPRPVVNFGSTDTSFGEYTVFWTKAGEAASVVTNATTAMNTLFTGIKTTTTTGTPVAPSSEELFRGRRPKVVDSVLSSFNRLSARVPSEDRARLQSHIEQINALEKLQSGPSAVALASCAKPKLTFASGYDARSSDYDNLTATAQIENAVMALACDVTRIVTLQFLDYHDPRFPFLFNNNRNGLVQGNTRTYDSFHTMVHEAAPNSDTRGVDNLANAYRWYMQQVAAFAKRLSEIEDGPGQTLLDSTLILSISEFGNGGNHDPAQLPVLLLGNLGGRIQTGRHLDLTGYTTGDLYTTLQSLLIGETAPFGMTGANRAGRPFHKGLLPGLT